MGLLLGIEPYGCCADYFKPLASLDLEEVGINTRMRGVQPMRDRYA
jgi:hypothetical protein